MPFRSAAKRAQDDVVRLEPGKDPILDPKTKQPTGEFETYGLGPDEWIAYWAIFPHSFVGQVTSAATKAMIDPVTGQMQAAFDAGEAAITRVMLGIVDWHLLDEDKNPVQWDPRKARELMDGIPPEAFRALQVKVGNGSPQPELGAPADPDKPDGETVGKDSGADSETSSTAIRRPSASKN